MVETVLWMRSFLGCIGNGRWGTRQQGGRSTVTLGGGQARTLCTLAKLHRIMWRRRRVDIRRSRKAEAGVAGEFACEFPDLYLQSFFAFLLLSFPVSASVREAEAEMRA